MDACRFFMIRYEPVHEAVARMLLSEVTDEQIRCRPVAEVNTIAWNVWHMARTEDLGANRLVAHRPQLFFEEGWGERLNVQYADFGIGMTADDVTELSARIDLEALRAYWSAVERRTKSIVGDLRPEDLDEVNDTAYVRRVVADDGMFREAGRWAEDAWAEGPDRSKGYFLGYVVLTHEWVHFSEAMVTRSLLGMPGR